MKLNLTKAQINKIKKGLSITIKPHQIGDEGDIDIDDMDDENYNKLQKAYIKGKGVRIDGGSILHSMRKIGRKMGMSRGDMAQVGQWFRPILNNASKHLRDATLRGEQMLNDKVVGAMDATSAKMDKQSPTEGGSIMHTLAKAGRKMSMSRGDVKNIRNWIRPVLNNSSQHLRNATLRGVEMGNNQMVGAMNKAEGGSVNSSVNPYLPKALLGRGLVKGKGFSKGSGLVKGKGFSKGGSIRGFKTKKIADAEAVKDAQNREFNSGTVRLVGNQTIYENLQCKPNPSRQSWNAPVESPFDNGLNKRPRK
jgi:hypothetical protein